MHVSTARALDINTVSLVVMLALVVPAAMLSDRVGRKPMLYAITAGMVVLAWPLRWLLHQATFPAIQDALGYDGEPSAVAQGVTASSACRAHTSSVARRR